MAESGALCVRLVPQGVSMPGASRARPAGPHTRPSPRRSALRQLLQEEAVHTHPRVAAVFGPQSPAALSAVGVCKTKPPFVFRFCIERGTCQRQSLVAVSSYAPPHECVSQCTHQNADTHAHVLRHVHTHTHVHACTHTGTRGSLVLLLLPASPHANLEPGQEK